MPFAAASALLVPIIMINSDNASKGRRRKDSVSRRLLYEDESVMPEPGRARVATLVLCSGSSMFTRLPRLTLTIYSSAVILGYMGSGPAMTSPSN